jgi:hypothetical protein
MADPAAAIPEHCDFAALGSYQRIQGWLSISDESVRQ